MRDREFVRERATKKMPWPRLAKRIEELGGLWNLCDGSETLYHRYYQALALNKNPCLNIVLEVLKMTGLTFEEAFSDE